MVGGLIFTIALMGGRKRGLGRYFAFRLGVIIRFGSWHGKRAWSVRVLLLVCCKYLVAFGCMIYGSEKVHDGHDGHDYECIYDLHSSPLCFSKMQ